MPMQARFAVFLLVAECLFSAAGAQTGSAGKPTDATILQGHYDAAERFQEQGKLQQAAAEYRLFVGDALAELALGEAQLGDYTKAAPYFDGALALEPNSPRLRLDYARAAMDFGDFDHARALAQQLLQEEAGNPKGLAAAHEVLGRTLLKMNENQQARKELEAAMALNPDFADAYNLAVACLDMDDDKCADRLFTSLEATYGDTPQIHMEFGRAWGESDFEPRAEVEFKKVIAEDPKFPEAHYCLAATYLEENEPAKVPLAEKQLQEELAVTPNDFLTWAAVGKLAVVRQNYAAAAKYLSRAIELNPKSPDAWLYQGQMQYNQSQWAQAQKSLSQAIQLTIDPSRNHYQIQKAYYLLGRILMREGNEKAAAAQMQMAQKYMQIDLSRDKDRISGMQGQNQQGMGGSQTTLTLKDTTVNANPAAVRQLAAFQTQIAPAIADSYNNLGVIAASGRDFSAATSWFQSAAEWNPAMPGLNYNWGRAAFAAARFGDAVMPLATYLNAHPGDTHIREALGISDYMNQDYRGCVTTLQPLTSQMASIPQAAFFYADSLVRTGRIATGIQRLTALERAHPDIASVHMALGQAYLDAGKASDAVPELESAVRLEPRNPDYHRELARAYRLVGRSADADRETRTWRTLQSAPSAGPAEANGNPAGAAAASSPN
ncbi:MAG TPA: tetratricopeptide repeat protein [Acidobacteriaceae bacterium]|nr:tetratricopeptide repeat protein [Acidobacteriaceae bacterium]